MRTAKEIREEIFRQAEVFGEHYREKNWAQAKYAYDAARMMSVFAALDEDDRIKLFGSRAYRDDDEQPTEGLFNEGEVEKVYLECIRANQTREFSRYPGAP